VIELEVPMSDKMREIQNAVLECVEISILSLMGTSNSITSALRFPSRDSATETWNLGHSEAITELRKSNTGLDMEEWTLDSALHRNFDMIIRRQ
jgi:DNA excision repair protein ERCC-4